MTRPATDRRRARRVLVDCRTDDTTAASAGRVQGQSPNAITSAIVACDKREDAEVRAGGELDWHYQGRELLEDDCRGPARKQQAEHARGQSQQDALGGGLTDEAAAAAAERQPNHELTPASLRAREHQVREVHAGDEQHETVTPDSTMSGRAYCRRSGA